jgi:hypothetical protein
MMRCVTGLLLCASLCVLTAFSSSVHAADELPAIDRAAAEKLSYRRDVWPIVKRHCWGCHSGSNAKGGLRMDSVALMRTGGESGKLFEPGKPDESLLLDMIAGDEPSMPPKQPPLSIAKLQILRGWILAGAKDDSVAGNSELVVRIPETYRFAPAVTSVAISPDGKLIAVACRSEVVLLDAAGKAAPRRLPTECDLVTHVEFSPDGKLLAASGGSPSRYGEVRFFNPADGKLISSRRDGSDTLFRGNFSPDGKSIALGATDGAVHIIPVDPKAPVRRFDLHSDWVLDVAYTPDGKRLVSGGRDKATKVSSVETGKLLRTIDNSSELVIAVASNETFAVSGGRARTLIGYEYKIALAGIEVTGSGNGSRPVSRRNLYVKNFESQPGRIYDLATSGDRKFLAVAGGYGDVRVYQMADRKRIALVSGVPTPVFAIALNHDGSRLAIGSSTGEVRLYSLPDGKQLLSVMPVPVAGEKQAAK